MLRQDAAQVSAVKSWLGTAKRDVTRLVMMGSLEQIWVKRFKGGPMDPVKRARLVCGRGLTGNANQAGKRQVTLISRERWTELMTALASALDPGARRANLLLSGIDLENTGGRTLRIGDCRLR